MKNRIASLLVFLLAGLLLTTAQITRAQQSSNESSRTQLPDESCKEPVIVKGAVRAPSRFEMRRRVRLIEVLALVGGVTENAGQTVKITHSIPASACGNLVPNGSSETTETYNLADVSRGDERANPYLRPGDAIEVSSLDAVYVVGQVVKPQGIYLRGPLTVTQAVAMTGGVLADARTDRVRISQLGVGSNTVTRIIVDLKAIKKHRAEDVVLQPYDIVEVPSKKYGGGRLLGRGMKTQPPQLPLRIIE
ncbi:MAG: hypothetical protein AUG51_24345 [Acidobacteria bacterium 13_1_20CM_3_53_8]|nr:MAG: hypothetical protein AUG51_24345 [Acidobacteria bacterium 13_1_20CM_3_53_8]